MLPGNERPLHTEWIERYLLGELQGEELEKFIYRLHRDNTFRQEVTVQRSIVDQAHVIGREDLRQDLKSLHRQLGFNKGENNKQEKNTSSFNFYAVAASILLLLAATAVFYFAYHPSEKTPTVAQVKTPELSSQPQHLNIKYQIIGQDPAIGFSGTNTDSNTTILLYQASSPAYRFDDTLRLYGNFAAKQLTLQYNQSKEQYTLLIDSLSYPLQRYRPKQALKQ
ncbi:hypothetical protein AHMF7605_05755 [Adhaeribacter arboris]|uniref:Uncharacterized protein n=1 Tax=Adhaeribacter arboris TaxID=2072846 RepID=A0A2T2YC17_9BACT|nr:hypothetical protein [Adhaeribacter arboris]PSR53065.1 hypothetical protein AHMF7605_05755 [Adhaeribacter arboris]